MPEGTASGAAIVGMAAVFPGAPDLARYWDNLQGGVDSITDLPVGRWDASFYDAASTVPERLYCQRGGFVEVPVPFDALAFGIMPVAAEGAEPDQLLALATAARALDDAGYSNRPFARDRASVILGRGGYLTAGLSRLDQRVRGAEQLVQSLRTLIPEITNERLAAVRAEFARQLGPFGPDTAIGLVPNLAASRIANRLDLHGAAYTVDAACASSLIAIDHACRELESASSDLVIAGGVHFCHDPTFWSVFCQLGALSRSQAIRPFDRRADGLLIAEGVGMVVLKRIADAERDGDRIYAVIRGTGVASDGRAASLMTPAIDGQLLAVRRAWDKARLDPHAVGLLEAHGTATPSGDAAEVETLARFFGPPDPKRSRAVLGSVKSMIGHAMPAAGAAGLIKTALAIYHGVFPPTLHCEEPRPGIGATRFRLLAHAEPWESGGHPRVAGVDAFGFGGINAHVVLESMGPQAAPNPSRLRRLESMGPQAAPNSSQLGRLESHGSRPRVRAEPLLPAKAAASVPEERVLLLAGPDAAAVTRALADPGIADRREPGPCRVALFDPTPERRARAAKIVARGEPWRGRDDMWFSPRGLLDDGGKIAFLFPGVDSSFHPRTDDVASAFELPLRLPSASDDLMNLGMGIIAVGRILDAALRALRVVPDMLAGHSIGEWNAMIAAEMLPMRHVDDLIASLESERVDVPGVAFLAVGSGVAKALPAIVGLESIAISHDNCPHQVILCGRDAEIDVAAERFARSGILCQRLPFRSGYHSPLFADFVAPNGRVLSQLPIHAPRIPIWSATTCRPYPEDVADVRRLVIDHLVKPVRFRELTEALYDDNARVFLQVGTGSLIGFVSDTLRGRPHLAVSANVPTRPGLAQLRRLTAALFVEGHAGPSKELDVRLRSSARARVSISLGVPLVKLDSALALVGPQPEDVGPEQRQLAEEFAAAARELAEARAEVLSAFVTGNAPPAAAPRTVAYEKRISIEMYPELIHHTFYAQPAGWSEMEDRYPVVPMTMLMALMMDAARELCPELTPIGLEGVRAARWLAVAPPVDVTIVAAFDGGSRVDVTLRGYATGVVQMAAAYPPAPAPAASLENARPAPIRPAELYDSRWMFHGPAYRGVIELGPVSPHGIQGTLLGLAAKGGLLDNAGQLLGYWVMLHSALDRLAMPVSIDRCRFFGPEPAPGSRVACIVRIRELAESHVRADVELSREGRVWACIEGWFDRRFDSNDRVWNVLTFPEKNTITVMRPEGFGLLTQPWRTAASRDLLARRYLGKRERAAHREAEPRRQAGWLLERIATKDCARQLLWDRGHGPLYPIEIAVDEGPCGPTVTGPFAADLRVAAAHEGELAVARVALGREVGIALVRAKTLGPEAEAAELGLGERALLPEGSERTRAVARMLAAKRAAASTRRREGVVGTAGVEVRELSHDRLLVLVDGETRTVETRELENHIVGWI